MNNDEENFGVRRTLVSFFKFVHHPFNTHLHTITKIAPHKHICEGSPNKRIHLMHLIHNNLFAQFPIVVTLFLDFWLRYGNASNRCRIIIRKSYDITETRYAYDVRKRARFIFTTLYQWTLSWQ